MKEKRAKAEQENEEKKKAIEDGGETIEQRKARLLAQRDLLRKQKQDKREAELKEFNDKMKLEEGSVGQKSLFDQFKMLDENKKVPTMGVAAGGVDANLERRRQIFKNVRKEIEKDDQLQKQATYKKKMTELEEKVQNRDMERQQKAEQDREVAAQ